MSGFNINQSNLPPGVSAGDIPGAAPELTREELVSLLSESHATIDCLADFVSEGGSRYMVGATEALRNAYYLMEKLHAAIKGKSC